MDKVYPVHYCLNNESDFEDYHPNFNKGSNELLLPISEVNNLLDRCSNESDNVGISFGGEASGKWDVLEVQGINGKLYNLQYLLSGSLFILNEVAKDDVVKYLAQVERSAQELLSLGFKGKSV